MATGFELSTLMMESPLGQFFLEQNVSRIGPEIIILACLLCSIVTSFNASLKERQGTWFIALIAIFFAMVLLLVDFSNYNNPLVQEAWMSRSSVLGGMFTADLFSLVVRFILVFGTAVVMLFTKDYINSKTSVPGEFYVLLLGALLGAMLMVGASDLIMLFVGLETLGISSYIMAGYIRGDQKGIEASLKYLIYGGVSTAILLFGFSLLYGFTKSTGYAEISQALTSLGMMDQISNIFPVIAVLIIGGFAFKLSAAPFHMWTPDVYEGAPTPVTAFLSVVSKVAGFAVTVRLIFGALSSLEVWYPVLIMVSVLSMFIGNVVALTQKNIKRLLAYSTIAHAGYILLGLVVMTDAGVASMFYYLLTYLFMNLGAFACVVAFSNQSGTDEIKAYAGLIQKRPYLTLALSFFLLSLAGMPITAGFFAKFFLFQSVAQAGTNNLWLVIVALITSTISLYYYLNVIRLMVIVEPSEEVSNLPAQSTGQFAFSPVGLSVALTLVGTLVLGFMANPLMELSQKSVSSLIQPPTSVLGAQAPATVKPVQEPVVAHFN